MGENDYQPSGTLRNVEETTEYLRRIGAENIASEIERMHIAMRYVDASTQVNYLSLAIDLHNLKEDRLISDVKTLEAHNLSNGVSYNNIVAGLGYAGFIGLLSVVRPVLPIVDFAFAAIFLAVSLIAFVVWTAIQGYLVAKATRRIAPLFSMAIEDFDRRVILERFANAQRERENAFAELSRFWAANFIFSLITGMFGALLVVASLAAKVFGFDDGIVAAIYATLSSKFGYEI